MVPYGMPETACGEQSPCDCLIYVGVLNLQKPVLPSVGERYLALEHKQMPAFPFVGFARFVGVCAQFGLIYV